MLNYFYLFFSNQSMKGNYVKPENFVEIFHFYFTVVYIDFSFNDFNTFISYDFRLENNHI